MANDIEHRQVSRQCNLLSTSSDLHDLKAVRTVTRLPCRYFVVVLHAAENSSPCPTSCCLDGPLTHFEVRPATASTIGQYVAAA